MTPLTVRTSEPADRGAIFAIESAAFGGTGEAELVERLLTAGDVVLELVAEIDGRIAGHILFSRLRVIGESDFAAVALAPLAVDPAFQRRGIGTALVTESHARLREAGENLSLVVGDPDYYGRFGYGHPRACRFESRFQCEAMQALEFGPAPSAGRLVYAPAFGDL